MPRGVVPRQPARTGRQDKVRVGTGVPASLSRTKSRGPSRGKAAAAAPKGHQEAASPARASTPKIKSYNPVAPERGAEILKRLNQMYPDVSCALTDARAWGCGVGT